MTENTDDSALGAGREADKASETPESNAPEKHYNHTEIRGRFNQYTSAYWVLALPALTSRYIGRSISAFFALPERANPYLKRGYATLVGLCMTGLTTFYAVRTYGDMKRIFSETLAWEFDKKPEDIGFNDIRKSKNAVVHRTVKNFFKYNRRRYLADSAFFNFLIPQVAKKIDDPNHRFDIYSSVDLGIGVTAGYLVTDVIGRQQTFFEQLQNFIDQKINHTDRAGSLITAPDLISLYDRHMRDSDPKYAISGRMDTSEWKNNQILFGRMAELMNQTYGNVMNREKADFTVPKLIYLLGEDLVNPAKMEQSLTYIEVASRYGMNAVKQVAQSAGRGMSMKEAIAQFPVILPTQEQENAIAQKDTDLPTPKDKAGFVEKLGGNRNIISTMPVPPASQAEKIAQRNDALGAQGIA